MSGIAVVGVPKAFTLLTYCRIALLPFHKGAVTSRRPSCIAGTLFDQPEILSR